MTQPQQPWGQAPQPQQSAWSGQPQPAPRPPKKNTGRNIGLGCLGLVVALAVIGIVASVITGTEDDSSSTKPSVVASATPSVDYSAAEKAAGIPPNPTGAKRAELLRALRAANPDITRYEDKAVDAARNQCSALNGDANKPDWLASQRFTYKDVTTTEKQGHQINQALTDLGFCKD
ncbi:hypothetical protein [Streptomyces sp. NPDC008150]|uniref:hypothetical protein n=1 Tax=Streptomyces sp. NPDC008150 TaxID=3364816 RepID=UPI0036EAE0B0